MPSDKQRIAKNESDIAVLQQSEKINDGRWERMFLFMTEGTKQREKMLEELAVIKTNQIGFKVYEDKCDSDRDKIKENHGILKGNFDTYKATQDARTSTIAASISFVMGAIAVFFGWKGGHG